MKTDSVAKSFVHSAGHSRRAATHAEKLLARIDFESGQEYLDVGCGNGAAPIHLALHFGLQVTGVDADRQQIAAAERASTGIAGVTFRTMDCTRLPFEAGRFHIVAAHNVLHHIPNWTVALDEMVRVLRPRGYLICTDIVLPAWAASLGRRLAGNAAGFPTVPVLESLFARRGLTQLHVARALAHYEAICRKEPARAATATAV
jgi:ubiquinone/menaquinone biosynthesis C-methylase UbiE